MKRILFFLFGLIISSLSVVGQQLHTTLDIWHPAQETLPDNVLDLIVVNNTVPQPDYFGHSTRYDDKVMDNVQLDLQQASTFLLFGATQTLEESRLFASVGLVPESQNTSNSYINVHTLSSDTVALLCQMFQADAALICNQLLCYDVQGSYLTDDYTYYAYLEAYIRTTWTLQFPDGQKQFFSYKDTLYWENEAASRETALAGLPQRQQALLDMSYYAGERFAARFLPTWETVDRYFYETDDADLQRGFTALQQQQWDEAFTIWSNLYYNYAQSRKKKEQLLAAYAAANSAVTCEIVDDLNAAIQWANEAFSLFSLIPTADAAQQAVNIQYYREQLFARMAEKRTK